MQVLELRNTLGSLEATDYASCLVRSLRTDEKIWSFLIQSQGETSKQISELAVRQKLNPGTLGLLALNYELVSTNYPDSRLQASILEECMVFYESFLQQNNPPQSLEEAAKLAVVLIEKRKITPVWQTTLLEIVNRMHLGDAKSFKNIWGSVLVISVNLVKDQNDLLADLLKMQTTEQGIESLVYCVLSLPISESDKAEKIVNTLKDHSTSLVENTLNFLISINEKELAQAAAKSYVGKYSFEEISDRSSKSMMENPEEALQQSILFKQMATVTQIAGETDLASSLLSKSMVILDAISTGIRVQTLSLYEQTGNVIGFDSLERSIKLDQNKDSLMVQELASVGVMPLDSNQDNSKQHPVTALLQAKNIKTAGNKELARSECEKVFNGSNGKAAESVVDFQPRFNPNWNPEETVRTLIDLGAINEAVNVASKLQTRNPASLSASLAAADSYYATKNYSEALPLFEFVSFAGDSSVDVNRKLADCYAQSGNNDACYKVRKQLIEIEKPELSDMMQFADAAIDAGRAQEVFFITAKIIEQNPMNTSALTINGKAYAASGNRELAEEYFKKAIDIGTDEADPWIGLSDLQVRGGEFRQSIETLRQAMSALPGNREIKRRLAEQLMDSEAASEALPILNDLAEEQQDEFIGILQIEAMKSLGLAEVDELVISLYSRYPENEAIAQAFAAYLIKYGKHSEAKMVLQGQLAQSPSYSPTALTYAEAVIGMDVRYSGEPKSISTEELQKVESIVNRYLDQDSENSHAQLVKAELLVSKKDFNQAYEIYAKLLEKQTTIDKSLWERIQAGFAQTAAFLGKFEVALAAIKQAVDEQPEWVGLHKIMAQIYGMAGELEDALEQAQRVLDLAPQLVEGAIWFADFLTGLGKSDVAEEKLIKIIESQPNTLLLNLKLVETKLTNGKTEDATQTLVDLKQEFSVRSSEVELLSAARLFDQVGDSEMALNCLVYRNQAYASFSAGFDVAGYEYKLEKFEKSLQDLDKLTDYADQFGLVQCIKADILVQTNDLEDALNLVQDGVEFSQTDDLELSFVPDSWKKLMVTGHPGLALQARILFHQGKAATCLDVCQRWLAEDEENIEARIMAIESNLALGEKPGQELYPTNFDKNTDNPFMDHLIALTIDQLIDNDQAIEAQQLLEKAGKTDSISLKLSGIRIILLTGHLSEAENLFDEVLAASDEIKTCELFVRIGLNRLFVKSAVALQRWNEALSLVGEAVTEFSWHLEVVLQALSTMTRAAEFEGVAKALSIQAHDPSSFLQQINLEEEINWLASLTTGKAEKEVERWLLRGKMAISPIAENIRAFALISPTPEDAAVMVAALHSNGQESTALQVARKFPTDTHVLFQLACIQSDGEEDAALETLNTLIANEPLNPAALVLRSFVHEKLGKLDLAINDLEQAISDWPNELKWRMKAASLWQEYGNNKNAILQLQSAYGKDQDNAEIVLELARALVMENENEKAIEILNPLAKKNPNLFEIWEILAEAQSNNGQLDQALESAKKASQVNPFSIKPYLMSGKIHLLNGNYDKALDQARVAVAQNKKDANAILFLAKVLHEKGEKRQALAALEMTSQCDNVTVQTMVDHVNLVKEINGGAYAKELISAFSDKYPENVDLMKILASVQEENGDTSDAEDTVKRALLVEPDEPELHLILGKISAETGQLDQAIHHLSQGIAKKGANTDGYLMLSKVFEQQREFTKALDALKQAMDVHPNDTRSYLAAANLYRNSKNYSAAEQVLQKAVEVDPLDVNIRRQLGALLALKLVHHSQEASSQS